MSNYLYGAAVQGIQSFIFQTNKLQEIVGASELVEEICTGFFETQVNKYGRFDENNLILGAAGNIKYIFHDEKECEKVVRNFPKAVMEMAPGITISQAVVEYKEKGLNKALQTLEDKLREQRNKVSVPFEIGFMGTGRNRRTGGVAAKKHPVDREDEIVDDATFKKLKSRQNRALFGKIYGSKEFKTEELLFNTDDLESSWLAVIHADGNGLGAIIQNLNQSFNDKSDEEVQQGFKDFSNALENITQNAAQSAFKQVVKDKKQKGKPYPVRPIVLGGDDLTVIIRADLAFDFTTQFLRKFEEESIEKLKTLKAYTGDTFEKGITACAGIAYVKNSYPFHYAVDLAEKLCGDAKNFVKGKAAYKDDGLHPTLKSEMVPKSSLAFFKVQDSFIEDSLKDMKERVLKVSENLSFDYGPYLIDEDSDFASVKELEDKMGIIEDKATDVEQKRESNGISKLRQWVTESYTDQATADFFLERMEAVNNEFYTKIRPKDQKKGKSIIYDVIQLNTLQK